MRDSNQATSASAAAAQAVPLRILVADDNELNVALMTFVLGDLLGHSFGVATNGAEALDALRRETFDVVLMDVKMPVMGGIEATQRIRQEWPAATRPRIIALTASVEADEQQACRDAGMDDYLVKPLDRDLLAAALARCPRLAA
ncbi:response regulator [Aquabacterium sp.]|uniref:response regulator n=1 Tax=Aquabacterium sp. TaxID=1872578 RepID=UPI002D1565AE|nr:response regulator [Aquabacterium sp.]HSW06247.1 response regulator [Aquabacterium sp.]